MSTARRSRNVKSATRLGALVLAMFGFGYALVPLYDVFCNITGIDGRTGTVEASSLDDAPDLSRNITVQFMGTVNSTLRWEFRPSQKSMDVHPGKLYSATFIVKNLADERVVGHAVPNVAPNTASRYFNKTDCFCFTNQVFEPGEERELPVTFVVDKKLPGELRTVTLSYTFFKASENT